MTRRLPNEPIRFCLAMIEVEGAFVTCNREHGHGGAHQASDAYNAVTFTVSWWPGKQAA